MISDEQRIPPSLVASDHTETPIETLVSLDGKVAVVTGGARGIGLAIVKRFAQAGATVVVADIDGALAAVDTLRVDGVTGIEVDLTDSDRVRALVDDVAGTHGGVDIWVNNAGIFPSTPILEMTDQEWRRVHAINLDAAFFGSREAARSMVANGRRGVIINISSVSGYRGRRGLAHYSSSKHAIRGLTRSLAVELGIHGIRALAIAPTLIITPGTSAIYTTAAPPGAHPMDVYDRLPLGRAGVPDDVARVALFAASELASFMTGSTLIVDAGQMSV